MAGIFDISGRIAVVIGGTSGIGRTLALGLAEHGANVIPTGRREDRLEEVCGQIEGLERSTLFQTTDVESRAANEATAELCRQKSVPYLPGAATVREIIAAMNAGAGIVKVFPGEVLGPAFVRAVKTVLPHAKLMPTGGGSAGTRPRRTGRQNPPLSSAADCADAADRSGIRVIRG